MHTVLAMLEVDGPTDALLAAGEQMERHLGTPEGLLARLVAPTPTGIVLWQLWASAAAREQHAADPRHAAALREAGMPALVTGTRSRTFEHAVLQILASPDRAELEEAVQGSRQGDFPHQAECDREPEPAQPRPSRAVGPQGERRADPPTYAPGRAR